MNDSSPSIEPSRRRAAVAFIFVTIVIDVLGFGLIIPVLPALVRDFMGGDPARGAAMYGWFGTVWAVMQFFSAPLLGAISDRFGRRPVILISCAGLGLDYIVMAMAPNLGWLLFGRIASGVCAASFSTSFAYIADVSAPENRASAFGMAGAAFGIGFVLGPALGGVLGDINPRLPFWGAAALALLSALYGLFVLPESLPADRRDRFRWRKANPIGALQLLRSHRELGGLALIYFLYQLAHCVLPSMYVLYTTYRFGWSTRMVGLSLMATGLMSIIVQGGLVRPVVTKLGERGAVYVGLLFGMAGFLGFALAPSSPWMWAALIVLPLWGLIGPGLQGLMTRRVTAQEQGKLQGANGSLTSIAGLIGPLLFTQSFAWFIDQKRGWTLPGVPFLLAGAMLLLALLFFGRVSKRTFDYATIDTQRGTGSGR
jgi:DHA1 family tetracycline resistance protein-like MFS transporter